MGQFMDVPEVGPVSLELPVLDLTGLSAGNRRTLVPALSIAVVSFTDVMITSRVALQARPCPTPPRDARAGGGPVRQGVAGGYPMSASSSRTALAYASGSTTRFTRCSWSSWSSRLLLLLADRSGSRPRWPG